MDRERHFRFEDPRDGENEVTIYPAGDGLYVGVAEEKAVDSYNQTFECSIHLDREAAGRLRDYLNLHFPRPIEPPKG